MPARRECSSGITPAASHHGNSDARAVRSSAEFDERTMQFGQMCASPNDVRHSLYGYLGSVGFGSPSALMICG